MNLPRSEPVGGDIGPLGLPDEVMDLAKAGIRIIQIDEPAIREGSPKKEA